MYHGTTSIHLPSIMKYGLLPNPPQKASSLDEPYLESFGGVYLTDNKNIAESSTFDPVQKFGGDPILITVQYVIGSGSLDEDLIFENFIEIGKSALKLPPKHYYLATKFYAVERFSEFAKPSDYTLKLITKFYEILREIIDEELETIMLDQPLKEIMTKIMESSKELPTTHLVRVTRPIKFRGKTRITQITDLYTNKILYSER